MDNAFVDETLAGNEFVEESIRVFYKDETEYAFMCVCMAIRKRLQEDGHMLFPAEITVDENGYQLFNFQTLALEDGVSALVAFTSQEELSKGPATGAVSNFIDSMLENLMQIESINGLLINPWGKSIFLGKEDIAMILTPGSERFV